MKVSRGMFKSNIKVTTMHLKSSSYAHLSRLFLVHLFLTMFDSKSSMNDTMSPMSLKRMFVHVAMLLFGMAYVISIILVARVVVVAVRGSQRHQTPRQIEWFKDN